MPIKRVPVVKVRRAGLVRLGVVLLSIAALLGVFLVLTDGSDPGPQAAVPQAPAPPAPVSTPAATSTPPPPPAPTPAPTASDDGSAATTSITLRRGDTLWALARTHRTTVATLQQANNLGHSTMIYAGHRLLVPAKPAAAAAKPHPAKSAPTKRTAALAIAKQTSAPAIATGSAAAAIAFAKAQLGVPYRWGGTGRGGFDCSGLTMKAWQAGGVHLPRTARAQATAGTRITRAQLQPGDLVMTNNYRHVQLYVGDNQVIEAPYTGAVVRYARLPAKGVVAYVHIAPDDSGP